jgi:hypothetical protein
MMYYYNFPGGGWGPVTAASSGTTFAAPSLVVRGTGEADVATHGPNNSLMYYWNMPGGSWYPMTV